MKNKKSISKISKLFVVSQLLFLAGAFAFFYFYIPHLDYPKNNEIIDRNVVDFKFRNANTILIDDVLFRLDKENLIKILKGLENSGRQVIATVHASIIKDIKKKVKANIIDTRYFELKMENDNYLLFL